MLVAIDYLSSLGEIIARQATASPLTPWSSVYVIAGSSAGALIGLLFVVSTLIAGNRDRDWSRETATYGTPTVVHFSVVLLVSIFLSAPWQSLAQIAIVLGLTGLAGLAYAIVVVMRFVQRARRREVDPTPWGDWLSYVVIPPVAYTALVIAAIMLPGNPVLALFGSGAAVVLLLFVGIRNAWDTVVYLAIERFERRDERNDVEGQ
jgi:amino acid transporter